MICPITATSISLEGKHFWIVRSLPIPANRYLGAKLALNLMLNVPVSWLSILIPELCLSFHAGHNRAFIGADPVGGACAPACLG